MMKLAFMLLALVVTSEAELPAACEDMANKLQSTLISYGVCECIRTETKDTNCVDKVIQALKNTTGLGTILDTTCKLPNAPPDCEEKLAGDVLQRLTNLDPTCPYCDQSQPVSKKCFAIVVSILDALLPGNSFLDKTCRLVGYVPAG